MNKLNNIIAALNNTNDLSKSDLKEMLEAVTMYYPVVYSIEVGGNEPAICLWKDAIDCGIDTLPDEVFEVVDTIHDLGVKLRVAAKCSLGWFSNQIMEIMRRYEMSSVSVKNVHNPDKCSFAFQFKDKKRKDAEAEFEVGVFLTAFVKLAHANELSFTPLRSYSKERDLITFGV